MILFFDCNQFILRTLDNCASYVDKIYVSYSELPWNYNKDARRNFRNLADLDLLNKSLHFDKVEIVNGVWDTEEQQRNECLRRARNDGFDYLIIQDADEFYCGSEYQKNLEAIIKNPDYSFYTTPWINFWKNLNYVIEFKDPGFGEKNTIYSRCANFAVNLSRDTRFVRKRIINHSNNSKHLPGLCHHLSYVLSDDEVFRKISTWGHTHQVSIKNWYQKKWLAWDPKTRYIHPLISVTANRAVPYIGELPTQLQDLPVPIHSFRKLSPYEFTIRGLLDLKDFFIFNYRRLIVRFRNIKTNAAY